MATDALFGHMGVDTAEFPPPPLSTSCTPLAPLRLNDDGTLSVAPDQYMSVQCVFAYGAWLTRYALLYSRAIDATHYALLSR